MNDPIVKYLARIIMNAMQVVPLIQYSIPKVGLNVLKAQTSKLMVPALPRTQPLSHSASFCLPTPSVRGLLA